MFCIFGPNLVSPAWTGVEVSRGHQGSPFLKIFTCPTSKICFFQYQIIYDLEEEILQIYLPDGQFYLPRAVGQWDMSSPRHWTWWRTDGRMQATTIPWGENWPRVKKTPKLVAKALATKFGFVPDCWTGYVLWCGQAQNVINLDFQVKFGLEGQGWLPPPPFPDCNSCLNSLMAMKLIMHKDWSSLEEEPYCSLRSYVKFWGHTRQKNHRFWPELSVSGL